MKIKIIGESKVPVTDNEISSLKHHVEDAMGALKEGNRAVLEASLKDIMEIAESLANRLPGSEQREV